MSYSVIQKKGQQEILWRLWCFDKHRRNRIPQILPASAPPSFQIKSRHTTARFLPPSASLVPAAPTSPLSPQASRSSFPPSCVTPSCSLFPESSFLLSHSANSYSYLKVLPKCLLLCWASRGIPAVGELLGRVRLTWGLVALLC